MKGIIIAAGKGSRLKDITKNKPKCLLEFCGKPLIKHQLAALKANNITDVAVIKGYKKEMINIPGLKYYINDNYLNNNILHSLFYAEPEMKDDVIISYSDILYGDKIIKKLIETPGDVVVVVDTDWKDYYDGRTEHPLSEAESVIFNKEGNVHKIGKIAVENDVHGEFIGMLKLSKKGCEIFKKYFQQAKNLFRDKPFVRADTFEKAYLTDMIQYLVDNGVEVNVARIKKGWIEIDTIQDLERAPFFLAQTILNLV